MAEAVGLLVLAGRVVGMGQAGHEDHARLLAERLNGHGHARGGAAGDHDRAVALDHRAGGGAGGVGLGLGVAGDELDLLAEDAGAVQLLAGEGLHHAAVALAVEVLDGQLEGAQLVGALVGIGAGLGHVEAERDGVALRRVGEARVAIGPDGAGEDRGDREARAGRGAGLHHATACEVLVGHGDPPLIEPARGALPQGSRGRPVR